MLKEDAPVSNIGFGALRVLSTQEINLLKDEIRRNPCKSNIKHCLKQYDNFMVQNGYKKVSTIDVNNLKADLNCYILVNTDCSQLRKTDKKAYADKCRNRPVPKIPSEFATDCDTWGGNSGGAFVDKHEGKVVSVVSWSNYGQNFGKTYGNYTTPANGFYNVVTNARQFSPTLEKIKSYNGMKCNKSYLPKYATAGQYVVTMDNFSCYATACEDGTYLAVKQNKQGKWKSRGFCVTNKYCTNGRVLNIINNKWTDLQCVKEIPNVTFKAMGVLDLADNEQADDEITENAKLKKSFMDVEEPPEEIKTEEIDIKQLEYMLKTLQENINARMENVAEQSDEAILYILSDMVEYNELDELREKYEDAKARERALPNRVLGAAAIGAGGIGGAMLGAAIAEQRADAAAEQEMQAYLQSVRCEYGNGKSVPGGETNVELPGGNDMVALYTEYATLANDLRIRKDALGLRPGIESEVVIDKADAGFYDNVGVGIVGGGYASIARALMNPDGDDAKAWAAQREKTATTFKAGGIVAGTGIVGGAVGNIAINGFDGKKLDVNPEPTDSESGESQIAE